MSELHDLVAHWFTERRGIRRETIEAFGIYTEGNDVVFPYPEGMLKRRYSITKDENPFGLDKEGRRFKWEDAEGNSGKAGQVPYLPPDYAPREWVILVPEGETDTMALWQALPDEAREAVSVIGLSGVGSFRSAILGQDKHGVQIRDDRVEELFGAARKVFVVLDNDDPYEAPDATASVEDAWRKIQGALGRKARRVRLPQGMKDLAEFFMAYDWHAFRALLIEASTPRYHYRALDLTQPPPPVDWLVEELIEMGVITVLAGDSGTGKSFVTQALTVDLLNGVEAFLAQMICKPDARVLYLDEENSEALVKQRLAALGFDKETQDRLRYISRQGVNLHENPTWFLEDAIEFEPTAVILDSQSRISIGVKENANDELTAFYAQSILPIPMMTGAACIVLHHTPKDGQGPRGGGAIKAAADQVLSLITPETKGVTSTNRFNLFPEKARREGAYIQGEIVGSMKDDGWVKVQTVGDMDAM